MEKIQDERLRAMVQTVYPDGLTTTSRWKGPTTAPDDPGAERDQWFERVARRRSVMSPIPPASDLTPTVEIAEYLVPVPGSCNWHACRECAEGKILVRAYRPEGLGAQAPAFVNFHGGAFWLGGGREVLRAGAAQMAARAIGAAAVVFDVDYRQAPEHKFPMPPEDCYAALCWIAEHAQTLDIDIARIAIGGASAGGALSAAVALMARDHGGPNLVSQVLQIPVTDSQCNSASMTEYESGYVFERGSAMDMWALYLRQPRDAFEPYASPSHATDLANLPAALVIAGLYDPLRDEGLAYGLRLAQAGVPTTMQVFPMCHGTALPETNAQVEGLINAHLSSMFRQGT